MQAKFGQVPGRTRLQRLSCPMPSCRTHRPRSSIRPVSSAIPIKSVGHDGSPYRMIPAQQSFHARCLAGQHVDDRFVRRCQLSVSCNRVANSAMVRDLPERLRACRGGRVCTLLRPIALAWYMAMSASRMRASAGKPGAPMRTPMLAMAHTVSVPIRTPS